MAPLMQSTGSFHGLRIAPGLLKAIARLKYIEPTPIQKKAIPIGIEGRDIIAVAQTGTGKTIAFGIPMIQRLSGNQHGRGLIIVPTRELAYQVDEALKPISQAHQIRTAVIIGGKSMEQQIRDLARHPRIVIATPGRLLDHLKRKTIDVSGVETLVLDEADRMLDMGFAPDINRIISYLTSKHQTMLFSATMPGEIMAIAARYMRDPEHIEIARSGASPEEISHEIFFVDNRDKTRLLEIQLRQRTGSALIFTKTKHGAKKLTRQIVTMGHSVAEIHSNRSLNQRFNALDGFKSGQFRILVATDIAARGIDVLDIELVINYDLPSTPEDYVHRIGRTGRAGRIGHAISFATFDQEKNIRDIEKLIGTTLPFSQLPFAPSLHSAATAGRTSGRSRLHIWKPSPAIVPPTGEDSGLAFGRKRVASSRRRNRR